MRHPRAQRAKPRHLLKPWHARITSAAASARRPVLTCNNNYLFLPVQISTFNVALALSFPFFLPSAFLLLKEVPPPRSIHILKQQITLPFAIMATSTTVSIPAAITISNLSSRLRRGGDATVSSNNAFPHPDHVDAKYHLPTPPTSISPSLAPVHRFKQSCSVGDRQGVTDSDVDVSDIGVGGVSKLPTTESHNLGPQLSEAAGAITPALLAKYHLPGILLQHGPLAIRHVTAHLISNIPGFSTIPPAKQRRLVVGALEGRGGVSGSEGEAGGVNGDVIFEKVGWGRWDARLKDDLPRDREGTSSRGLSPATSVLSTSVSTYGAKSNGMFRSNGFLSATSMNHSTSYTGESGIFVQSEEEASDLSEDPDTMEQDENEADMMSLDEQASEEEDADMTDEEDWAQMGAAMLRRQAGSPVTSDGFLSGFAGSPAVGYGSMPTWQAKASSFYSSNGYDDSTAALRAREEREAVEALVKLSSI
ncbi:uncharacterized protein LAJ45_02823 [Morchella importuna]|uniref:uncharacterized protein n=1 Tax=Morchella importuna TaxID=1174673 RepID=UPI001E8D5057|nr:uncharacterized protein LAJ45_02823 [Morchella importuna]KAH8153236.1 hypothetical protein LAJ45_02823 [Morchella importuna]